MPELQTPINHLHKNRVTSRALTVQMYPPPKEHLGSLRSQYRYEIVGASAPRHDPVYNCIRRTITKLSAVVLFVAAANIKVYNMTNSPVLWPPSAAKLMQPYKLHAFKEYYEEFPMTPSDMVIPDTRFLHASRIQVAAPDGIKDLKTFLTELPLRTWLERARPILSQQAFWRKNGKTLRVMHLPLDVRLVLWQHILGGNIYPITTEQVRPNQTPKVVLGLGDGSTRHADDDYKCWWNREGLLRERVPNYKILGVSRQVRSEALKAACRGSSRKHFTHGATLQSVVNTPNTLSQISPTWLTRITLNFSYDTFFSFAGVFPVRQPAPAQILPTMTTLTDLELVFPSPYEGSPRYWDDIGFPWTKTCVKVLADWTIRFLIPHIKHLPTVRLSGCVKTAMKSKWDYILAREYAERNETYRSHSSDWNMESLSILQQYSSQQPPGCVCPKSCDGRTLKPSDRFFDYDDTYVKSAEPESSGGPSEDLDDPWFGYRRPECL